MDSSDRIYSSNYRARPATKRNSEPDVTYQKSKYLVDKQAKLYIFSDGVYEVEKSDGSMWQFEEFADFMNKSEPGSPSRLDRLYRHAETIRSQDSFEDDFTIVEVAFG